MQIALIASLVSGAVVGGSVPFPEDPMPGPQPSPPSPVEPGIQPMPPSPLEPTPNPFQPGDEACRSCQTMCAPCQACADSKVGECFKCWHCWDWEDDELEDDDNDMDEDCDALDEEHDWFDAEVRCLTDDEPSPSSGDGRRRFTRQLGALGGDGRRRMPPSHVPVDCRTCWGASPPPSPAPQCLRAHFDVSDKDCSAGMIVTVTDLTPSECHHRCCDDPECEVWRYCPEDGACDNGLLPKQCQMGENLCTDKLIGTSDGQDDWPGGNQMMARSFTPVPAPSPPPPPPAGTCVSPTTGEEDMAQRIAKNEALLRGDWDAKDDPKSLDEMIANGYDIDALMDDWDKMLTARSIWYHHDAIDNIGDVMKDAKDQFGMADYQDIYIGWFKTMVSICGVENVYESIQDAIDAFSTAITTWQTLVQDSITDTDVFSSTLIWRGEAETQYNTDLTAASDFKDALYAIPKEQQPQAIRDGYSFLTDLMKGMPSERELYNKYYMRYVDLSGGNPAFHYVWNAGASTDGTEEGFVFRPAPHELDPCTIAKQVADHNNGCISKQTPGLEDMKQFVEVMTEGPRTGLQFSCDGGLSLDDVTGCYENGLFRSISDRRCSVDHILGKYMPQPIPGWPSQGAIDFCHHGLVHGQNYMACGPTSETQSPCASTTSLPGFCGASGN